jgi:glycosyltransferase involved in cell wall biosynthesis
MSSPEDARRGLHVLTITPFFPSDQNEVNGCFVAEPIEEFKKLNIRSSVIAVSPVYRRQRLATATAPAEWLRYPQIPGTLGLSSAGNWLYPRLLRRIQNLHRENPIDVIHAHSALPAGHAAALLSRRLKIPFVVTVHGLDVFNAFSQGGISSTWRRKVSVDVYRSARNVICISGKVQEILRAGSPPEIRSTIVYNGVDPTLFSPPPASLRYAPEILMVGNLIRSKGQDMVLRTLPKLQKIFPNLRCHIVGEGTDRFHLEALTQQLGIASLVQLTSRESRSAVAEAMRRCSVFVLPSSNEALGCVYLEAMSCGKPVIACREQGIDEVIIHQENGWLIPVDGLEDLEEGLKVLFGSIELRTRIGDAARQTIVDRLTLAHQAQHLATIYREATE